MRCAASLVALGCGLGLARAVPNLGTAAGNESGDDAPAMRRLQAGGRPDQCSDDASFQAWLALVNSACCEHAETPCENGLPSSCDEECANVLTPFKSKCKSKLRAGGMTQTINTASRTCPHVSESSRGCPKNIPSVSDHGAVQSCGSGSGFWPVGSVCPVTCAAPGGGHRRAQAGGSSYICTQGGNWLATNPISCSSSPPPPPASPTQGRFVAVDHPMSISQAVDYCRQNYAALASIHSIDEQRQAAAACSSTAGLSDQAAYGGYGCWIGFEDSAAEGGFVWTDGSSVDFVNFAPGEPNGGTGESAVTLDMRGPQGIITESGQARHGMWNDDQRTDTYLLHPICETSIPQARPGGMRSWGSGNSHSVNIKVCVDADDYLFFQDDRMWLQYGGNWGMAGGNNCPGSDSSADGQDYVGKAYINDEPWDISSLQACQPGSTCPVSTTFTDERFMVPQGCQSIQTEVTNNAVRGQITVQEPTATNGWKGELLMSDPYNGADVFDFTITLTCIGTAPVVPVRLSCVHNAGGGARSGCNTGRMEVWNPNVRRDGAPMNGAWGSVCGQWVWNNDNAANLVCQQLGFASGEIYTFGATNYLPTLPVTFGYRVCQGGENHLFNCPRAQDLESCMANPECAAPDGYGVPEDMDCEHGCVGADGLSGTADDTFQTGECDHGVDQGAICYGPGENVDQILVEKCGHGGDQCHMQGRCEQGIVFGCIDYYTTQCEFDATNTAINTGANAGTYTWAMRAFARCAAVEPQAPGYCHGSLKSAAVLANHQVCSDGDPATTGGDDLGGSTTNIGFHIRMPFTVTIPGDYNFRMHADYGSGSFMGVDGADYTPGDLWGHALIDATSLTAGTHEFDVLGFEPCCDGHAEMEIHLPCDSQDDPWRIVQKGPTECLVCDDQGADVVASCTMDTESAGCCGNSGGHVLCRPTLEDGTCDPDSATQTASDIVGRFVAVGQSMNYPDAVAYCEQNYAGIASIHSHAEQGHARTACAKYADAEAGIQSDATIGCWIGLTDDGRGETGGASGGFTWADGSAVEYVNWNHGEPNGWNAATLEDNVAILFAPGWGGGNWADLDGSASSAAYCADPTQWDQTDDVTDEETRAWCHYGQLGLFPLCQVQAAPPPPPNAQFVWGTGVSSSFRVQVCVDHVDTLYFQDDRLWLQYGGQYAAAGSHTSCPDRYLGRAYVNNVEWDISTLQQCEQGIGCPVSRTFTDPQFMVPQGCSTIDMQVTKNAGRGIATSYPPTRASSFRGEVELSDEGFGGADVMDVTVTLTCQNQGPTAGVTAGSVGQETVRLSCVAQSQHNSETTSFGADGSGCRMGRLEVYNPNAHHVDGNGQGTWGTVCGHWLWDNDNAAGVACRQLGFADGFMYTFGASRLLPTLPIVAGFRTCEGTEANIFQCAAQSSGVHPIDRDCWIGCRGADGTSGTADDSIDPTCTHSIDQGVICQVQDSPQYRSGALTDPCHANTQAQDGSGGRGALWHGAGSQEIIFACVEYYTTQCSFDITHTELANGIGSYMTAMRAFAECAEVLPEPIGYCHDSIQDAAYLANHDVCGGAPEDDPSTEDVDESLGATTDIGFHIRIPFQVTTAGLFTFRYHMDMGLGSYMGVDGPEYRPGNTWGHVETSGTALAVGEHEWEVLGFEDCCDGHAELEVHIPCDRAESPWRIVTHGDSVCMSCEMTDPATQGPTIDGVQRSCSAATDAAACCRQVGHGCQDLGLDGSATQQGIECHVGADVVCSACDDPSIPPTTAHVGRFVAIGQTMHIFDAIDYCEEHHQSLASIHSWEEQQQAASACMAYSDATEEAVTGAGNHQYGCWIGFQDLGAEGGFVWMDGSSVEFVDWAPGEPNGVDSDDPSSGEDAVELDFRERLSRYGEWNDATTSQDYEMFPICETHIPPPVPGSPTNWGTGTTAAFRVRICVDETDDIFFQDDRLWIQYGGQYSAAGTHPSCPDRYRGKAYIGNQIWDISALGNCVAGENCPVSPTFTDEQFMVPMGCQSIQVQVLKTRGRGDVTTETPSAGNGFRGAIHIHDTPGAADVYDVRVTLTCVGGGGASVPQVPVRLSCTHNYGTDACHMGRIEVFNPTAEHLQGTGRGTWGTVCGHYTWDNDNVASMVCRHLGYSDGELYTYGHTTQLPSLPIVAGFRACQGTELNMFHCEERGHAVDPDCLNGCVGPDGLQGTLDDTLDPSCTHSIDQGAICHNDDQPSLMALPTCRGWTQTGALGGHNAHDQHGNDEQPILFSCVEYYSTECTFDVTNTDLKNELGSYMTAMRAFAQCAEANLETPGYCHGALNSAETLRNGDVCQNGATTNIGWHIRVPFRVNMAGTYNFRMHADYGLGGYIGVDGATFTGGNIYSHVQTGAESLAAGEHEFEALGFDDCCDGFANIEVHLPCDSTSSPWRIVQSGSLEGGDMMNGDLGRVDCLTCGVVLDASCSGPIIDPGGGGTGIDPGTALPPSINTGETGNGGCPGGPWCDGTGR